MNIGEKVKALRQEKGMTLKDLSQKTSLSTGFLSQFERGITTIAVEHLATLATVLDVNINYFFDDQPKEPIVRSYNQKFLHKLNETVYKSLSPQPEGKLLSPKLVELLPRNRKEDVQTYNHHGEEFVYVLEGILTLLIEDQTYHVYPGDSAHYLSTLDHNWTNETNSVVKLVVVHTNE